MRSIQTYNFQRLSMHRPYVLPTREFNFGHGSQSIAPPYLGSRPRLGIRFISKQSPRLHNHRTRSSFSILAVSHSSHFDSVVSEEFSFRGQLRSAIDLLSLTSVTVDPSGPCTMHMRGPGSVDSRHRGCSYCPPDAAPGFQLNFCTQRFPTGVIHVSSKSDAGNGGDSFFEPCCNCLSNHKITHGPCSPNHTAGTLCFPPFPRHPVPLDALGPVLDASKRPRSDLVSPRFRSILFFDGKAQYQVPCLFFSFADSISISTHPRPPCPLQVAVPGSGGAVGEPAVLVR